MAVPHLELQKAYYVLNREKRIAYQKEYKQKNMETIKEYQKAYYLANKNKILNKLKSQRNVENTLYPKENKKKVKKEKKEKNPPRKKTKKNQGGEKILDGEKILKPEIPKKKNSDFFLPEDSNLPEPFSDFRLTENGYTLDF